MFDFDFLLMYYIKQVFGRDYVMDDKIIKEEKLDNEKVIMRTLDSNGFVSQKIVLPEISPEELINRYKKIKPIVRIEDLYYYLREFSLDELKNRSYIWNKYDDKREIVDMDKVETIGEFSCYHTYGYYIYFKPSIEEVLSQFPDDLLKEANLFYLYSAPQDVDDLNKQNEIINAGCHKSRVKALVRK